MKDQRRIPPMHLALLLSGALPMGLAVPRGSQFEPDLLPLPGARVPMLRAADIERRPVFEKPKREKSATRPLAERKARRAKRKQRRRA